MNISHKVINKPAEMRFYGPPSSPPTVTRLNTRTNTAITASTMNVSRMNEISSVAILPNVYGKSLPIKK